MHVLSELRNIHLFTIPLMENSSARSSTLLLTNNRIMQTVYLVTLVLIGHVMTEI